MNEATQSALIVGGFGFAGVIGTAILNYFSNRKVKETVGVLAKNIDGAMSEIKETIAAKNLAEGQLKGIADEQARAADLIVEPTQVHDALNGAAVRKQIDNIEAALAEKKNGETLTEQDDPVPVVDVELGKKIDRIITPALEHLQDTVDEQKK